jgi:hypothetical protein
LDELDDIRKKKMEKLMREQSKPAEVKVEYPNKPVVLADASAQSVSIANCGLLGRLVRSMSDDSADYPRAGCGAERQGSLWQAQR